MEVIPQTNTLRQGGIILFLLLAGLLYLYSADNASCQIAFRKDSLNKVLWFACEKGDLRTVKKALDEGAYVNHKRTGGWMPIHVAVSKGDLPLTKFLIGKGAKTDVRTLNGLTLLHLSPNDDLSAYLLKRKAKKDAKAVGDWMPIHEICMRGQIKTLKLLLKLGADPNARTQTGATPLLLALKADRNDIAELLLKHGADPLLSQNDGLRPLHVVRDLDLLKKIAEKDSIFFEPGFLGMSPFESALRNNRNEIVAFFLQKVPDLRLFTTKPWLCMAIEQGNEPLAFLLLSKKIDVNQIGADGNTPVHFAVQTGNLNLVKQIIARRANVNVANVYGLRPLHYARSVEMAKLLISGGADVQGNSTKGTTPLHYAVRSKNLPYVKYLMDRGAQVNKTDEHGNTPLHYASNLAIARALVEAGAVADTPSTTTRETPLMLTTDGEVARYLLQKLANSNAVDRDSITPLMKAIQRENVEVVYALLNAGAKVNAIDKQGRTPLYYAVERDNFQLVKMLLDKRAKVEQDNALSPMQVTASPRIAQLLLERGASLYVGYDLKKSPWNRAIERNDTNLIRLYLNRTKNLNFTDGAGYSLLHLCIEYNAKDVFLQLLNHGINRDISSEASGGKSGKKDFWSRFHQDKTATIKSGDTPLLFALREKKAWFAQTLIERGADPNLSNNDGDTPLMLAARNRMNELARLLIRNKADINAVNKRGESVLFCCNDNDLARFLIELGADVKAYTRDGRTALHKAAFIGDAPWIRRLLAQGADVNAEDVRFGTPLHVALRYRHPEAALALIVGGASVSLTNVKEETPLHLAVQLPNLEITEQLIKKKANVNAINADNDTPLTLVFEASSFHPDFFRTVRYLIDNGADINAKKSQIAPLVLAVSKYNTAQDSLIVNLVDFMLKRGADTEGDNINTGENALNMALLVLDQVLDTAKVVPKGLETIIAKLLDREVPVNVKGRKGTPLLHAITIYGNKYKHDRISFDIIVNLIKNGASVQIADASGNTALHKAAYYGDPLLTELVLARRPKLNAKNKDGETALAIARKRGHTKVADLLKNAGASE